MMSDASHVRNVFCAASEMAAAPASLAYSARREHALRAIGSANPERGVKLSLVVFAIWIAGCGLAGAQDEAPSAETRRQIDKAMGFAIAADTLCGTAYLNTVVANGESDGFSLDDLMRRDKPQIDEQANRLIAENDSEERKDKFCQKIRRDVESAPAQ
jgi:hypothetical protein